jgi:raffinose/stachyose/melibiose transport system permease protein
MIPNVANMVPLYAMMRTFGLLNSRIGMNLVYSGNVSMGILLFTSFIKAIPVEVEQSAEIDGCNFFQKFWHITLPMLKPVTIAYIMISILSIWNDFLFPMLFLSRRGKQTITLAVYTFKNERGSDWGAIFALMTLVVVLPMVLFITNQKYFYKGMTLGSVKL